ncbi:MAG: maleate cis-trans isomerase family protein [Candidatus Binatia bacterium]
MNPEPRIGLIIPSSNSLTERQFNRYAPPGVGIHVTRLRMTGKWRKPLAELKNSLIEAAEALSDVKPGVIVFHCTANSMENGLAHEAAIVDIVEQASGCAAISTAQAITQAFDHCGVKKLVLISPYVKATNEHEVKYLSEAGYTVVHELGLGLETHAYANVTPEEWKKIVKENSRADADGYFLSCTNTRMIEAIDDLERDLGKPLINSNQATLWACLKKLRVKHSDKTLGRLFN